MSLFYYKGGRLYCESVSVESVADTIGTPVYLYSRETLKSSFAEYQEAFSEVPHLIAYAMKANANTAILQLFAHEGGGADIVSEGELYAAMKAGVEPQKIVFAGVGKRQPEMAAALKAGILMFNVESKQELDVLNAVAGRLGVKAPVALRVNPDVNPKTHHYISTGLKKSKFGIAMEGALSQYQKAARLPHIRVVGIHSHIGSQLTQVKPFIDALTRISHLIGKLKAMGLPISHWDIGGGLGITYNEETPPKITDLAAAISPLLKKIGCTVILEPGRSLVGNAGILVTRVIYTKETTEKRFVVVDAGMNDLIRPSLYEAYHDIVPVTKRRRRRSYVVDVVGPVCESGDFLAKERALPSIQPDELLAVKSAGAYGFAMASCYNSRPRPAEVMASGAKYTVIRERESIEDLIRLERMPTF